MKQNRFFMPGMTPVELSISYVDVDLAAQFPQSRINSHIHEECEIYVNLSGDVSFEVENRIYPVSRGSVIITRPYEYHHCMYHSSQEHAHYWITFSAGAEDPFLQLFFQREKGRDNLIRLDDAELARLCTVLDRLLQEIPDDLQKQIDFLRLVQILRDGKREGAVGSLTHLPRDVVQALHYMDDHLTEEISVGKLAMACSVSVNTLERHFKEIFNLPPLRVLRKKRLVASLEHLRRGEPVSESAMKSGFADYSNYIQLFRQEFGVTPLQYRKFFSPTKNGGKKGGI